MLPSTKPDPIRTAVHVLVYVVFFLLGAVVFGWAFGSLGYLLGTVATSLLAAGVANWLSLRIFEARSLLDAGLWWNRASARNLAMGLAGGIGSAVLVLAPPLAAGAAYWVPEPVQPPTFGTFLFFTATAGATCEPSEYPITTILLSSIGNFFVR